MVKHIPDFPTNYEDILQRIASIRPKEYGKSRNFVDGAVTYLSPYISRGVISTQQIYNDVLAKGFAPASIEKFIQELAWRDYWQQVWIVKKAGINSDVKNIQKPITNYGIPKAIIEAATGITAIDLAIKEFYETGYLHNHLRMYIASMACNMAHSHWKYAAQWMYYHLLDGDWASNALSWQWVAGANSHKKYYANQDNINTYTYSRQKNTFLDLDYSQFSDMAIPEILKPTCQEPWVSPLPKTSKIQIESTKACCIYNYYNLDPNWRIEQEVNRVLLLEPSVFQQYPVGQKALDFMLALGENIPNLQIFVGEFQEFITTNPSSAIYYKEHPLNSHYKGTPDERDWMFKVKGYYPSFFGFWKKCQKEIKF